LVTMKNIMRVVSAISLVAIAFAHLYDMALTMIQRQYLREQAREQANLPDLPPGRPNFYP
jgi:hypothetical protein